MYGARCRRKEILDSQPGMFCSVLGHNHPKFMERVLGQTRELLHTGTQFLSPAVMEAGYKMAAVTPGKLKKTIFLSTGTEANEFVSPGKGLYRPHRDHGPVARLLRNIAGHQELLRLASHP